MKRKYKIQGTVLVFIGLAFLGGCASKTPNVSKDHNYAHHIISVNKFGEPLNPQTKDKFETDMNYTKHIDDVLQLKDDGKQKDKIMIYIHGGLNNDKTNAKKIKQLYEHVPKDIYPVFIHWSSHVYSTYKEHLFHHRQGEYWPVAGYFTSPFVWLEDVGNSFLSIPMSWTHKSASYFKSITYGTLYRSDTKAMEIYNKFKDNNPFGEFPNLIDNRSASDKIGNGTLGFIKLLAGLITSPILDGAGTGSWEVMKRRTKLMFNKNDAKRTDLDTYTKSKEGALIAFFNALAKKQEKNPKLEIILTGHSMGTMVINTILKRWPDINISRIVYMAAACSITDFQDSVIPYLKKHHDTKFINHTLHPIAEHIESHYGGFGGTGSLLTQIDNIYESPVSRGQKTLGRWVNLMNEINMLNQNGVEKQMFLNTMPFDRKYPTEHGHFNDPKFWNDKYFWDEDFGKVETESRISK